MGHTALHYAIVFTNKKYRFEEGQPDIMRLLLDAPGFNMDLHGSHEVIHRTITMFGKDWHYIIQEHTVV
jgi:Ankyrin repeat